MKAFEALVDLDFMFLSLKCFVHLWSSLEFELVFLLSFILLFLCVCYASG